MASGSSVNITKSSGRLRCSSILEIGESHVRKSAPIALDLNGIAKGCGVDRLAETLGAQGLTAGLVGIDGDMRAHSRASGHRRGDLG